VNVNLNKKIIIFLVGLIGLKITIAVAINQETSPAYQHTVPSNAIKSQVSPTVQLSTSAEKIPVQRYDLNDLYQLAKERDSLYRVAQYTLAATRQRLPQALAGLLPTIASSYGQSRNQGVYQFGTTAGEPRKTISWNWNLQLNQPLLRWQNWQVYNQAEMQIVQAEAQAEQVSQELILRLAQAYFEFNLADENLRTLKIQVRAYEAQLKAAEKYFTAGTKPIMDVYEAKARYDSAIAEDVLAENQLVTKKINLEKIVGSVAVRPRILNINLALPLPDPLDLNFWQQQAIDSSPVVNAQIAAMKVAEYEIKKNSAAHLPTIDMVGSLGNNFSSASTTTQTNFRSESSSSQIGIQLNIPIYNGGGVNAKVKESVELLYKAQEDVESAKKDISATAQQAYAAVKSGVAAIAALESAVTTNQKSVAANQVGYRLGTRTNNEVLNAEQQLASTQRDLLKAKYDYLNNSLKLKSTVGGLNEQEVSAISQLFLPLNIEYTSSNGYLENKEFP